MHGAQRGTTWTTLWAVSTSAVFAVCAGDADVPLPASELWLGHAGLDALVHLAFPTSQVDADGSEVFVGTGEVRHAAGRASPLDVTIGVPTVSALAGLTFVDEHLAVLEPGDGALFVFELRRDARVGVVDVHDVRGATHGSLVVESRLSDDATARHALRTAAAMVAVLSAGACAEAPFARCEAMAGDGCGSFEHHVTYGCDVSTGAVRCGWTCFAASAPDVRPVPHGEALFFGDLDAADLAAIDALVAQADFAPVERIVGSLCSDGSGGSCEVYGPGRESSEGLVSIRFLSFEARASNGAWRLAGGGERTYVRLTSAGGRVVDVHRDGPESERLDRPTLQRVVDGLEAACRTGASGSPLLGLGIGSIRCPADIAPELISNGTAHTSSAHLLVEVDTDVTRDCEGRSDVLCVERDAVVHLGTFDVQD
ncbi:MAG: hypothetical protein H6825_01645 [Planctomycetes bacterium]|nr:hypothetical protein [Planctomycetota bacterium]